MLAGRKRSRKTPGGGDGSTTPKKSKSHHQSKGASSPHATNNNTAACPTRLVDSESIECIASPQPCPFLGGPCIRTPLLASDDKTILLDRLAKEVIGAFGFALARKRADRPRRAAAGGDDGGDGVTFTMGAGGIQMAGGRGDEEGGGGKKDEGRSKAKKTKKKRRAKPPLPRAERGPPTLADLVVRKRFVVGVNQCTRALEAAAKTSSGGDCKPSLVLLSRDVRPPTVLAHIPVLCRQMGVPAAVLPGRASAELGRAVGGRSAAVALFLPRAAAVVETDETANGDGDDGGDEASGPSSRQVQECHRRIDSYVKFALSKINR
jgi:ribosomal protein L7Ae-like RNA K-turn-binding protein